ncbi:hypothetical protein B0H17DRAFT_1152317 [Mycena rosella]|uniref:Uncharacterized protein n=1 Tax=Mycena rosella TaxID=1033263 RepID=A0AAD7BDP6_MYCRO|nr:hypothetical protein B0H17DRAFT_1152317 [Mycena rosella]
MHSQGCFDSNLVGGMLGTISYMVFTGSGPKRAFSAGGITISKRRNKLKGDIVEALQVLKSLIKVKDMFYAPPSMMIEDNDDPGVKDDGEGGWDCFLDDVPDNYEPDVSVE